MTVKLKIGTRGSPLALAQTHIVAAALKRAHPALAADGAIEIVTIVTTGDMSQAANASLSTLGGKGLFTKEIEEALIDGRIDCAIHSMKDMPTTLPAGLDISHVLPREDVRDAFFSTKGNSIEDLPAGAVVGTSSLRRQAIILSLRPDLKVVTFRGNVGTRLQKLADGVVDATLLAVAGLNRLGQQDKIQTILPAETMLPAVAQGAVGIETRIEDHTTRALLDAVHCSETFLQITAERAYLARMDGSCKTPLAALLTPRDKAGIADFHALFASPDGRDVKRYHTRTAIHTLDDARAVGMAAGQALAAYRHAG